MLTFGQFIVEMHRDRIGWIGPTGHESFSEDYYRPKPKEIHTELRSKGFHYAGKDDSGWHQWQHPQKGYIRYSPNIGYEHRTDGHKMVASGFPPLAGHYATQLTEATTKPEPFHKGMVMYHGTSHDFQQFSDTDAKKHKETPEREIKGHFFTTDPMTAHSYATRSAKQTGGKRRVIKANLHLNHPYDATKEIQKHMKSGMTFADAKNKAYRNVDRTKHDGVYHTNKMNAPEYVAFNAHQIVNLA